MDRRLTVQERLVKYITLWMWGGTIYYLIEVLFRWIVHGTPTSHPSMFVLGGICLLVVGALNNYKPKQFGFAWQVLIGTTIVIILELIAGVILNLWLELGVWDYSNLRFNILGQVSLLFSFLFMPVVAFAIWLDDFLRWKIYGMEKPTYRVW